MGVVVPLGVGAEVLNQWLCRRDARAAQPAPVLRYGLARADGSPKTFAELAPGELGVEANRYGAAGEAVYLNRDADTALDEAFAHATKRIVVVRGPRLAGTTSALAQAAQLHLPGHHVVGLVNDPRLPLTALVQCAIGWSRHGQGALLWLDGPIDGLTQHRC
ncbi:hypothetical protein ACQEU3_44505 [Spirillospora sp. CA-253888]